MKFNLGDKVRIRSNGVIGIIIARGYNEYLNENDKQQSFEEYQIEADKYYQCNEDEIEMFDKFKNITWKESDKIDLFADYESVIKEGQLETNPIKESDEMDNQCKTQTDDVVNHPSHYTDTKIEVMDYIEDKGFNFALGNTVKYISRAGKKGEDKTIQDLEKASWYLNREIERLKNLQGE